MVISRTPFRISFFGGATDYPAYYENNGYGAVLSASIDKYCYISCRYLPPFFGYKHRIIWSKIENVKTLEEIEHPSVREILKYLKMEDGVEVHHIADLPARAGLGSSSTFAVGLLNALHALNGRITSKQQLAEEAIHIEQECLAENVGCQDQTAAAFGGINKIIFRPSRAIEVQPVPITSERLSELESHLMLFFTGKSRTASEIAGEKIKAIPQKLHELERMKKMVDEAIKIIQHGDINDFGKLLHETWQLKRSLSAAISNDEIDEIYQRARDVGALGGKILGAGGGGFILFFIDPLKREQLRDALKDLLHVPFSFERGGSQIIYYGPISHVA